MNGARQHLFAGTGLADDQHRGGMARYLLHQLHEALEGVAADDKTLWVEWVRSRYRQPLSWVHRGQHCSTNCIKAL